MQYMRLDDMIFGMALPTGINRDKRDKALTVRISSRVYEMLTKLAKSHNLSQGDVITHLIETEVEEQQKLKEEKSTSRRVKR